VFVEVSTPFCANDGVPVASMCWTWTLPELATVYQTKTAPPAPSAIKGGKLPNCS